MALAQIASGAATGSIAAWGKKPVKTRFKEVEPFAGTPAYRGRLAGAAEPGALERLGLAGAEYQGPLIAALSEFEETGLEGLREYLGQPLPTEGVMYKSAVDEIMKTLSGEEYDPSQGKFYQAYKTSVLRELEEAKDRVAARASAGDKFFGGGRIATEGELEESATGDLAMVLGQLAERERERRLGAVPQALGATQYGEESRIQRITASQQLGALPRIIEQAGMDAQYQEWLRALNDLGIALDTATGLATYTPGGAMVTSGGDLKKWAAFLQGFMQGGGMQGIGGITGGGGGGGQAPSSVTPVGGVGYYGAGYGGATV